MASVASAAAVAALNDAEPASGAAAPIQGAFTETRYATQGYPDRFMLHQTQRGQVVLEGEALAGATNPAFHLSAVVLDRRGSVVARSDAAEAQSDFQLTRTLEPGDYTVVVEGAALQSPSEADTSYQLSVRRL